jgi:peptidoglycan lytic transglycosylase G
MTATIDGAPPPEDPDGLPPADPQGGHLLPRPRSPVEALQPRRVPRPRDYRDPGDSRANMHPVLRVLNRLLTLTVIAAAGALALLFLLRTQFDQPGPLQQPAVVVIPQGEGVGAIAEQLEKQGVISDRRIFVATVLYFNTFKHKTSLKAGEYPFAAHVSMRQVLAELVRGKSVAHKVTIAEGLTSQQVVERLLAQPDLTGDIPQVPPEGSLMPDTYLFARGESREHIIERMQEAQQEFLAEAWQQRDPDLVLKTPQQALILASIVEKETSRADERPRIAAVFENRLKKGMRLQSDPTIIYGLVGGKGSLGRPILESELEQSTPYNTYQINGLPPTPISNPGRAAIKATLNPSKTDDLYFVADGTGGHAFAATLAEHNRNVAKWRQIEKAREAAEANGSAAAGDNGGATELPAMDDNAAPGATAAQPETAAGGESAASASDVPPLPLRNPRLAGLPSPMASSASKPPAGHKAPTIKSNKHPSL